MIKKFLEEKPGNGNKELTSNYVYYVETLEDKQRIFLTRPAALNKGFDFIIHVENKSFRHVSQKRKSVYYNDIPSMDNIINDLIRKRRADRTVFRQLYKLIERVYNCEEPDKILSKINIDECRFQSGYSVEFLLKIIKWFFIEQDIRYWNWSGRYMFLNRIRQI